MQRADLAALTETRFDVVVIGGGVTGVATAREAALRGHSVLLVEQDDVAAGTSSRSSKLIHGGLRYLQNYQFKLVAQSLRERERARDLAPHLVTIRPFLYLLYDGYPESNRMVSLGLTFYDVASGSWRNRRHRMLNAQQVLDREPHLNPRGLRAAGLYYDALTDDARYTLGLAQGAAVAGAQLINHAQVIGLITENGAACGVQVRDRLTDNHHVIAARQVLNTTGPWSDQIRKLEQTSQSPGLRPTKGVHIAVRREDYPLGTPTFLRSPDDQRIVWPIPSLEGDVVYIGTTDTEYDGDINDVRPSDADIGYLLNAANQAIPEAQLTKSDIVGSWAGLRPLIAPQSGTGTTHTSREHEIFTGPTGMITIAGGKLTSSLLMASQLVDTVEDALIPHGRRRIPRPSRTIRRRRARRARLPGAAVEETDAITADAHAQGVPAEVIATWTHRYGSRARTLLWYWQQFPDNRHSYGIRGLTAAEIHYLVAEEMVRRLSDLLIRRTGIFFWERSGGLDQIKPIADQLAQLLDWSTEQRRTEIETYRQLVDHHRFG